MRKGLGNLRLLNVSHSLTGRGKAECRGSDHWPSVLCHPVWFPHEGFTVLWLHVVTGWQRPQEHGVVAVSLEKSGGPVMTEQKGVAREEKRTSSCGCLQAAQHLWMESLSPRRRVWAGQESAAVAATPPVSTDIHRAKNKQLFSRFTLSPAQWSLFGRQRPFLLTCTFWWNTCPIYEHLGNPGTECEGGGMAAMNLPSQDRWLQRNWRLWHSWFLFYAVYKFFVLRSWLLPRAFGSYEKALQNTAVATGPIRLVLALFPQWVSDLVGYTDWQCGPQSRMYKQQNYSSDINKAP